MASSTCSSTSEVKTIDAHLHIWASPQETSTLIFQAKTPQYLGMAIYCSRYRGTLHRVPVTVVLLDHLAFCKPPANDEESKAFSWLLDLSRFPQVVYVKFSALFRVSRKPFPHEDLSHSLSQVVSTFGANRVMWGLNDFPYVVPECGYKGAKEAVSLIAN